MAGKEPAKAKFKLVLGGHSGVGKSCLIERLVYGRFDFNSPSTVGASFLAHKVLVSDGWASTEVQLDVWDTAGQEKYATVTNLFFRGAHAAVIAYSIADKESFQKVKEWVQRVRHEGEPNVVVALVGTKSDMEEKREVSTSAGKAFADQNGLFFAETSARTGDGVKEVFSAIANKLTKTQFPAAAPDRVVLHNQVEPKKKKSFC